MSEQPYTNRELDSHFNELKVMLIRIESQTTRTNGRVSKLENWRSYMLGGMAVIVFSLPAIAWIFMDKFNLVQSEVSKLEANVVSRVK